MLKKLNAYLATIIVARQRANAKAALTTLTRINGKEATPRHALIERRISEGARVIDYHGDMVLMNTDGSWLDTRNITRSGLRYAAWLSVHN